MNTINNSPKTITLYDSYKKSIVEINPQTTVIPDTIKIYSCGPTVYGYQHIGNMRAIWLSNTIVDIAKTLGWKTEWVLNITDVGHLTGDGDDGKNVSSSEDKMEKSAKSQNKTITEIVNFYTNDYFIQTKALNLSLPENVENIQKDLNVGVVNPKASEFIKEQMILALELLSQNKAYLLTDGIYFDSLANQDLDVPFKVFEEIVETKENSSYTGREIKNTTKNPSDFALWKFVDENALQKWRFDQFPEAISALASCDIEGRIMYKWGCPGWHSECVAMICRILGSRTLKNREKFSFASFISQKFVIDIHTGGEDHIDIHHKNEILQSKSLGFNLSKYWVHNKFVLVNGKKMSKSLGNGYLICGKKEETGVDSLESLGFDPIAYRLMLQEHNYTTQLDFTSTKLAQSQNRLFNIRKETAKIVAFKNTYPDNFLQEDPEVADKNTHSFFDLVSIEENWQNILANNLDLPRFLEEYTKFVNRVLEQIKEQEILVETDLNLLIKYEQNILRLDLFTKIPAEILELGQQRQDAKEQKDYKMGDVLRQEIQDLGYQIDDYKWGFGIWVNPATKKHKQK